jgi:hypothetical protein
MELEMERVGVEAADMPMRDAMVVVETVLLFLLTPTDLQGHIRWESVRVRVQWIFWSVFRNTPTKQSKAKIRAKRLSSRPSLSLQMADKSGDHEADISGSSGIYCPKRRRGLRHITKQLPSPPTWRS